MNEINLLWSDANEGRLLINGFQAAIYKASTGRLLKNAADQRWFHVDLCFDYNQSSKISVSAATIRALIKKIEAMETVLPFIYSGKLVRENDFAS